MGSNEPSLVPEWLKSNGGGKTGHQSASSISRSDAASVAKYSRNKSFRSIGESDSPRTHSDHSSSYNSRRSFGNNIVSSKHSYSSFSRSAQDYNRGREKGISAAGEIRNHDCFGPRGKEAYRHSHSLIPRKQDFLLPRTVGSEFTSIDRNNRIFGKGLLDKDVTSSSIKKAEFDRKVAIIPVNEKQGVPDTARSPSPGLTLSAQGLPIGSSALVGERWSALAEVPAVVKTDDVGSDVHQVLETSSACADSIPGNRLCKAEAPAHSCGTTCTASQKPEQIVIKQCRQLIPMMPIHMAPSSADKLKPKIAFRNGDLSNISKIGLHLQASGSAHLACQSPRGAPIIHEPLKTSPVGKLYVLRPPWEKSTAVHPDGYAMATDEVNKGLDTIATVASSSASLSSSRAAFMELKALGSVQNDPPVVDKKRMLSHAQSRNEFFNSVRRKTSMNTSICTEASPVTSMPVEQSIEAVKETVAATSSSDGFENGLTNCIGGVNDVDQKATTKKSYPVSVTEVIPGEEEEAEFLRSLGWEEYGSEDDGLTEEEINSFYQEVMKLKPTLKLPEAFHQPNASLLHKLMLVEVHPD